MYNGLKNEEDFCDQHYSVCVVEAMRRSNAALKLGFSGVCYSFPDTWWLSGKGNDEPTVFYHDGVFFSATYGDVFLSDDSPEVNEVEVAVFAPGEGGGVSELPDVLMMLKMLVLDCCRPQYMQDIDILRMAKAVIEKAEGGEV